MIPQETVDLILDTARIEDVVGDFVTLKRRGANFVACCPFHNEKTPSFYVSPAKGIFKCFGCGKAGSAVGFVMEHEHMDYADALRYLAGKYHIEVHEKDESPEDIIQRQKRESLMLACDFAGKFFVDQLSTTQGRSVGYAYYKSRGLEDSTIRDFALGWAPSGVADLRDAAIAAGYKDEYLQETGLTVVREDGTIADKFRERVMFPIYSLSGRVIAFSGRTLRSDNPAKYVNSPDTPLYTKSNVLYGMYQAKAEIARQDKCIVVEGNLDMVMMHQLGIKNVVAPCGTSFTTQQMHIIHKFTENLTVMFDGDSAGIHAALKVMDDVLREGLSMRVVLLPDGEDPDSFSKGRSLDEVLAFIKDNERDCIDFKTERLMLEAGNDPVRKSGVISAVADTIAVIPDAVKRSVYVEALSARFNIESGVIFERISTKRQAMIAERKREEDRARRREEAGLDAVPAWEREESAPVEPVQEQTLESYEVNKTVAPAEREILTFLLTHGTQTLDFPSDSEFYTGSEEDKDTVADFIISSVESDGRLLNPAYQKVFDAFVAAYDSGNPGMPAEQRQDIIVRSLLDSPDRDVAFLAAQLSTQKYRLTMKGLENSMTTLSSWLVSFVPKTMLLYADKKLEYKILTLRTELASADPARMASILQNLSTMQKVQQQLKVKLGR